MVDASGEGVTIKLRGDYSVSIICQAPALRWLILILAFGWHSLLLVAQETIQTLDSHLQRYRNGEIAEEYFIRQLLNAAQQQIEVRDSIHLLEKYQPHISQTENSSQVTLSIARHYELLGDWRSAIKAYQRYADGIRTNHATYYQTLVRIAHLHLELGEIPQAYTHTLQVIKTAPTDLQHQAVILLARIERIQGNEASAQRRLELFTQRYPSSPHIRTAYVALYEIQQSLGKLSEASQTRTELITRYPDSVEASLLEDVDSEINRVIPLPSSSRIFEGHIHTEETEISALSSSPTNIEASPSSVAIQVGSFTKQNNAQALKRRLKKDSYQVKIIERDIDKRHFWQVRIYVADDQVQQTLTQLKAQSIKGFIVKEKSPSALQ